MSKAKDITGMRFGKLIALQTTGQVKHGEVTKWECICDCGNKTIVNGSNLRNGVTKSCGCLKKEVQSTKMTERLTTHNYSRTRLYHIWQGMKHRCYKETCTHFDCYGGRGIKVCPEWKDNFVNFKEWALNNDYSDELTLDRINTDGDYEPSNCRWQDRKQQANNKRNTIQITFNNETHTITEWSEITGIKHSTIWSRLYEYGWSVEKTLTTFPKRKEKRE